MTAPITDRWRLPLPALKKERGFWDLHKDRLEQLRELWNSSEAFQNDVPDFDTWMLETEPAKILLEVAAFGDAHFIAEMNDWARALLLVQFASGKDLDWHGEREHLPRFENESDERYRERIILERKAKEAFATDPWYMRHAKNTDKRVREVAVTGNGRRKVEIAILSDEEGGVPSEELLSAVSNRIFSTGIIRNNDIVSVVPAVLTQTSVTAHIWLTPSASERILDGLCEQIVKSWNGASQRLGRDLTRSWLEAQLHISGVQRVEVIAPDNVVEAVSNRAIALGDITLIIQGRAW